MSAHISRPMRSLALLTFLSMAASVVVVASAGAATRAGGGTKATTMTIALAVLPGSLDTAHWEGQGSNEVWAALGLGVTLLRYKPIGKLVSPPAIPKMPGPTQLQGALAQSWKQDKKGNVTLNLRAA